MERRWYHHGVRRSVRRPISHVSPYGLEVNLAYHPEPTAPDRRDKQKKRRGAKPEERQRTL